MEDLDTDLEGFDDFEGVPWLFANSEGLLALMGFLGAVLGVAF